MQSNEEVKKLRRARYLLLQRIDGEMVSTIQKPHRLISLRKGLYLINQELSRKLKPVNLIGEIWKDIEGYEGHYQVSNFGRVKSIKTLGTLIKPTLAGKDLKYYRVWLHHNREGRSFILHRLVAKAFVQNPNNYPEVNHIDCNDKNNFAVNLEWVTRQQNMDHAVKNRLVLSGENQRSAKFTENQVREMRALKANNPKMGYQKIADIYGINSGNAWRIINKIEWKYVE